MTDPWLRSLWAVVILTLLMLGSAIALNLYQEHEDALAREKEHLVQQAAIVEANLSERLAKTSATLETIRAELPELLSQPNGVATVNRHLQIMVEAMFGIRTLALTNAEGTMIASNRKELVGLNISNSERFKIVKQGGDPGKLYVSAPFMTPLGNYTISVSRVMPTVDGKFNGYISALVDPEYFNVLLKSMLYASDMRTSLIHGSGKIIFRAPDPESVVGKDLSVNPGAFFVRHLQSGQSSGVYVGKTAATGEERMAIFRNVWPAAGGADKPLVITPSRTLAAIHAPWRKNVLIESSLFALIALISIVAMRGYQRRVRAYSQLKAQRDAEHLRAEEALRKSEAQLRALGDNLPNSAVYQYARHPDGSARFLYVSAGIEPLCGVSVEDVLRDPAVLHRQSPPDYVTRLLAEELRSARELSDFDMELPVRRPDGALRWMHLRSRPHRESDGSIVWDGVRIDITERKAMMESLAQAKLAADAASLAKSSFLSNMSHEIRTPLNGILGMAQVLKRESLGSRHMDRLDKIVSAGRHLLSVINNILDISKIESGKVLLAPVDFDLEELLADLQALVGEHARLKGLNFAVQVEGVPRHLHGDVDRLRQALVNYLANAIKFTVQGQVELAAQVLEEDAAGYLLRFEVRDTGIGIADSEQASLFQAFQQVDASMTRRFGGTGLGLAITRKIARLMGGDAGMHSQEGVGSTFWITLRLGRGRPLANGDIQVSPPDDEIALRALHGGKRILLVEDEPLNQLVVCEALAESGLEIDIAGNGCEAVAMAERTEYALILMDVRMPLMDGMEATRAIREMPQQRQTPILAITANAFAEDRQCCFEAGMNDFIGKPFERAELYRSMLKWLHPPGA